MADYLTKILRKEANDGSGLIYGMGHAVYTLSDPRAVILKRKAMALAAGKEIEREFRLLDTVEKLTPELMKSVRGSDKVVCANVDMYSGLVYRMLGIPDELFTPAVRHRQNGGLGGTPYGRDPHRKTNYPTGI